MRLLIIVGTSREGRSSIHPARAAYKEFEDQGHDVELFDLKEHEIPFLGKMRRNSEDAHPDVEKMGEEVEKSDGLVLVTPEYNHSYSGELKNAIDHLYSEYNDMPFFYITVSAGGFGGVRALSHLHDVTLELGGFPGPDLPVSNVRDIFEDGEVVDDAFERRLEAFVQDCEEFFNKLEG